ncbi:MAG: hypothetical protein QOJ99_1538 [Bryobacterales bacterium]|jgi:hypothetical protein|nr:hypothetical protein [Bryobacterales bacterium]
MSMMTRRQAALAVSGALTSWAATEKAASGDLVRLVRVRAGGIQPQVARDDQDHLHLVYFTGDAHNGDLFYVLSTNGGVSFSDPVPVNSQRGSAIAAGTICGAQLAVGKAGRVHVAWNGSNEAKPQGPVNPDSGKPGAPMLYTRLNHSGKDFEPQRNLMHHSFGLDGGGSLAADKAGNVYVTWHGIGESEASGKGAEGEARRRVWLAKSADDGQSFETERKAWSQPTGACGCCGMKAFADRQGNISVLYRSATESVHRDIYLLRSKDRGQNFQGSLLHKWDINACPMSSMDIAENGKTVVGTWETGGQVYWARLESDGRPSQPVAAPGDAKGRKHPRVAVNENGEVLLVWTEGTGWQKGGSLAWQLYDSAGQATAEKQQLPGIPAWSFAGAVARRDNSFSVFC